MVEQLNVLADKSDYLRSIPESHTMKRTNSQMFSSDLHMGACNTVQMSKYMQFKIVIASFNIQVKCVLLLNLPCPQCVCYLFPHCRGARSLLRVKSK